MRRRKIQFKLVKDADGYPPFGTERVWAAPTEHEREYILENIPFFARAATIGDTVKVSRGGRILQFVSVVKRSPRSLLRVITYDDTDVPKVLKHLRRLGCSTEFFGPSPLIAVDVPIDVSLSRVQKYLDRLAAKNIATYEEPILRHP